MVSRPDQLARLLTPTNPDVTEVSQSLCCVLYVVQVYADECPKETLRDTLLLLFAVYLTLSKV